MCRMTRSTTSSLSPLTSVTRALCDARRNVVLADASPFADAIASEADAYAVQRAVASELRLFADAVPRHWKSGGPDREAAMAHAPLPDAGVWQSPARAGQWPLQHRAIEAEIALRLGRDVTASMAAALTPDTAHELVDAMTVSIELVDTRWRQPLEALPALLKLADMTVHGALVLGEWIPYERRDWSAQRCVARIGRRQAVERVGTHSLGDPAWLLPQWLRHVTQAYGTVPAGTVVTTGSWVGLLKAAARDLVEVEFDGVGRVSVQL